MVTMKINSYYNFSLYPNTILGTSFRNAKLLSILDYTTALKFSNVEILNQQMYPYLPPGTSSSFVNYTYYLFQYKDKKIVIADVWIVPNSLQLTNSSKYTIILEDITPLQLNVIRDQLRVLGIAFTIVE